MSQRKNYFIQKGAQSKFILTLLLLIFLVAVISFCNLYVIGNFVLNNYTTLDQGTDILGFLRAAFSVIWFRLLLIIVVNVIIVAIIGVFYSHQFAGPSFKFESSIKEIAQGNLAMRIYLRKSDSMHNVAEALNVMIDNFRTVIQKANELAAQIKDASNSIKPEDEDSDKALASLRGIAGELEDLLAGFKLNAEDDDDDEDDDESASAEKDAGEEKED